MTLKPGVISWDLPTRLHLPPPLHTLELYGHKLWLYGHTERCTRLGSTVAAFLIWVIKPGLVNKVQKETKIFSLIISEECCWGSRGCNPHTQAPAAFSSFLARLPGRLITRSLQRAPKISLCEEQPSGKHLIPIYDFNAKYYLVWLYKHQNWNLLNTNATDESLPH